MVKKDRYFIPEYDAQFESLPKLDLAKGFTDTGVSTDSTINKDTDISYGRNMQIPGFEKGKFEGYIPEERIDPLSGIQTLYSERIKNQSGWEQAGYSLGQATNEAVLGTVQALAAIGDLPSYAALLNNSEKSDEDFHNSVYDWAKNVKENINQELPIYSGDRFDSGWFWQNLGQTVGSAASFFIPGMGGAKLLGKLGQAVKLGTTATATLETLGGAAIMRHAENFQEASNIFDITKQSAYNKYIEDGLTPDEAETKSNSIAGEAAAHDYKMNASNYIFDVLQMGAILKPKFGKVFGLTERQPYKVLKAASLLPESKIGRITKWIVDPAKGIAEASSEGLEEVVNQVSQYESQRDADIKLVKLKMMVLILQKD
jgi:hypothetical protein